MPKHSHPHFDSSDPLLDAKAVATLDLHGFPAGEVEPALRAFLETWKARAPGGIVHVITGRGRGSKGAPILAPRAETPEGHSRGNDPRMGPDARRRGVPVTTALS